VPAVSSVGQPARSLSAWRTSQDDPKNAAILCRNRGAGICSADSHLLDSSWHLAIEVSHARVWHPTSIVFRNRIKSFCIA